MKDKIKRSFLITGILFLLFAMLTAAVLRVDVQPIGPEGSPVGLATVNSFLFERIGVRLRWYEITDWLGIAAIGTALGFAVLGLVQLVKRRSLWKVDRQILLLGAFYVMVAAVYVFFEVMVVNFRPVMLYGKPETSYPSSHAMIVICIMATAMSELDRLFGKRKLLRRIFNTIAVCIMAVTVVGRMISGVHWFTDIAAGVLLSAALVMLYHSLRQWIEVQKV